MTILGLNIRTFLNNTFIDNLQFLPVNAISSNFPANFPKKTRTNVHSNYTSGDIAANRPLIFQYMS